MTFESSSPKAKPRQSGGERVGDIFVETRNGLARIAWRHTIHLMAKAPSKKLSKKKERHACRSGHDEHAHRLHHRGDEVRKG